MERIGLKKIVKSKYGKYIGSQSKVFFPKELLKEAVIEKKSFKNYGVGFEITLNGKSWKVRLSPEIEGMIKR